MDKLCVVPCGQRKIWSQEPGRGPTPAVEVYVGSFSRLCREYAQRFFDKWIVLSAKYGFLYPQDIVPADYNVSFNRVTPKPISIDELRCQIASRGLAEFDTIVVPGGRRYVEVVVAAFGGDYSYELPLAGAAGIGVMMQRLRRALHDDQEIRMKAGG